MELATEIANAEPQKEPDRKPYALFFIVAYLANLFVLQACGAAHMFAVLSTGQAFLKTCQSLQMPPVALGIVLTVVYFYSFFAVYFILSILCVYIPSKAAKLKQGQMALFMALAGGSAIATNNILASQGLAFFGTPLSGAPGVIAILVQIATALAISRKLQK